MKALTWCGKHDVRVENVADPKILAPRDCVIKTTMTAICGSDLHLYDGYIPRMKKGDILGHEFMGTIEEVGPEARERRPDLNVGDRVVIPFTISCGNCWFCKNDYWSCCDNSNTTPETARELYGAEPAGLFGYSHILGGYAGGQAEAVRVPYADVGPFKIPDGVTDEQALFLTDIFPTGYQAAYNADITGGETVAVWGAGPVGLFAVKSALLLGAEKVIAIDDVPGRLELAAEAGATTVDFSENQVYERLQDLTGGRGPDACIDAVGLEAHGLDVGDVYDRVKTTLFMATDRPAVLRQAIMSCRKAGTVSIPGVYGGLLDKIPFGAAFAKGLTMRMGQTHVKRWLPDLLGHIQEGRIDPTWIISHRMRLDQGPEGYKQFADNKGEYTKVVLTP